MISLQHIDKAFGNHQVLKDFSMDIKEHEFVSIMGPSGSGKTTILNLIGLLDTPDTGTVQIKEKAEYRVRIFNISADTFSDMYSKIMPS